jgi:hypothetical protein
MKKSKQVLIHALTKLGYTNSDISKISINSQKNQINFIDNDLKILNSINSNSNEIVMSPSYDIILVMGQSNTCYGTGLDPNIDFPDIDIKQMGRFNENNKIIDANEPLHNHEEWLITSNRIGIALPFAKLYKNKYLSDGRKIVIIPCGKGSTGFNGNHWNPGDVLYQDAVFRTNKILNQNPNNRLVAILWQQGESDAWDPDYGTKLDNMIVNLRNDIIGNNTQVPFLLGGFVPYWLNLDDGLIFSKNRTSNIIKDTPNRLEYCGYVDPSLPTIIEKDNPEIDSVHYDAPSLRTLSNRYFLEYKKFRKNPPVFHEEIRIRL